MWDYLLTGEMPPLYLMVTYPPCMSGFWKHTARSDGRNAWRSEHARGAVMAETPSHGVMATIELGIAIRNKEEEEKDTASGGAPTHRTRHRHGGPRLARRRGTMAAQFAWFPANRGGRARHTLSCGHVPLSAEDKSKKRSHLHAHMTSVARRDRRRNGKLRSTTAERDLQHQSLSR